VRRDQLHAWREIRNAGEDVVDAALEAALSEGRAPTSADITRHIRGTFNTGEREWYTPAEWVERARDVLGRFDVDPASNPQAQETVKATRFYTKDDDGLAQPWHSSVWLNPAYAQPLIAQFVDKLVAEVEVGNVYTSRNPGRVSARRGFHFWRLASPPHSPGRTRGPSSEPEGPRRNRRSPLLGC
jgi:hypothetical protein